MPKKKVLIITERFQPINRISSVRACKLAKYLARCGSEVTVLCPPVPYMEQNNQLNACYFDPEKEGVRIVHFPEEILPYYYNAIGLYEMPEVKKIVSSDGFSYFRRMMAFLYMHKQVRLCKKGVRRLLAEETYDDVVVSYAPHSAVWLGLYAKKISPRLKLVVDFRDPVSGTKPGRYKAHLEHKYLKNADAVTTVSQGVKDLFCSRYPDIPPEKIHVITNGYDPDDAAVVSSASAPPDDGRIHLVYTGAVYNGKRRLEPLLEVFSQWKREKNPLLSQFVFDYAGGESDYVNRLFSQYGLSDMLVDHAYLSRPETLTLQRNAGLLLLLSWNTPASQGILTGKFYEYLLAEKPILALVSGSVPNSELKGLIDKNGLGFAWEEGAQGEQAVSPIAAFLTDAAAGRIRLSGRQTQPFQYPYLAQKMQELL